MESSDREACDERANESGIPEDVATLYRWAGLEGMRYRDFSASRRARRAQEKIGAEDEHAMADGALDRVLSREVRHSAVEVADIAVPEIEATGVDSEACDGEAVQGIPAWLQASRTPQTSVVQPPTETHRGGTAGAEPAGEQSAGGQSAGGQSVGGTTLLDVWEQVAARWSVLNEVLEEGGSELSAMQPERAGDARRSLLALFSLAGGVGKTSLTATLGRILSMHGEKVLLIDTTSRGVLPFYFGERALRPGEVRACLPREGGSGATVSLVACSAVGMEGDERRQKMLADEIRGHVQGNRRVVLDVATGASWLPWRLADLQPTVLVPMAGEISSALSVRAIERIFQGMTESGGRALLPYYLMNQFDASLALHLDVREALRRRLGERLLGFAVRRAAAVGEALAAGMTVVEYAPDAAVLQDYNEVACWLREGSPPTMAEPGDAPWGTP